MSKGSTNRSKTEFSDEVNRLGAEYSFDSGRECTTFNLQVGKGDCGAAIDLLGDAICNPALNSAELELLKD